MRLWFRTLAASAVDRDRRRTIAVPPDVAPDLVAHLDQFVAADADALVPTRIKGGPVRHHGFPEGVGHDKERYRRGPAFTTMTGATPATPGGRDQRVDLA